MTFPNLARGKEDHAAAQPEVDLIVKTELEAAGITAVRLWTSFRQQGEVPAGYIGVIEGSGWKFERRWYYYCAKGPGIPPDVAEELHQRQGRSVRVDGHCGCPSPTEWFKGFGVGRYHVDDADGLKALSEVIHRILESSKKL